ncbi:MAG TPA: MFS transporter [Solirubrobacteraceae bacterium]|nr:MFS transporter [Solirubrobacteraceae bacterium]
MIGSRVRLPIPLAFASVAAVIGLALYASATPSPLYGVYQARWHFSTPVLTLVYATYALGVLTSLLAIGGLSDQTGRRPVLCLSLLALLGSMGLYLAASSLAWLFAARALQGLATGAALGAAGAALIELAPAGDARHAALVNGAASTAGIGAGAFISSLLVEYLPAPRTLPFVLVAALLALLALTVSALPEPVLERTPPRLRPQRPAVPAATRRAFVLAALGVTASWSVGGVYLALGPGLAGQLLGSHGELAGGIAVAALAGPAGLAQVAGRRLLNRTLTALGATLLALGMALTGASVATGSAAFFLASSALSGVGFGLAFMGALRHLTGSIPDGRRGEVMSAFYVVAYLSLSLPAIAAGFATASLGLSETFEIFSAAVAVLACAVALGGLHISEERVSLALAAPPDAPRPARSSNAAAARMLGRDAA